MKTSVALVVGMTVVFAATAWASQPAKERVVDWKKAEKNYIHAMASTNEGVRQSAARFVAEYRLTGALEPLKALLKEDKSERVRMAAALSLMVIGGSDARAAVEEASIYDGSDKVCNFCRDLLVASGATASIAAN